MAELFQENGFTHRFSVRWADGLDAANLPRISLGFRKGSTSGVHSMEIRFDPDDGGGWLGSFRKGDGRLTGVYPCPSPDHACVIASGRAYMVHVFDRLLLFEVPVEPVLAVLAETARGCLLLNDFQQLCACGAAGVLWRTRLVMDELVVVSIQNDAARCQGWNAETGRTVVSVSLEDGEIRSVR